MIFLEMSQAREGWGFYSGSLTNVSGEGFNRVD